MNLEKSLCFWRDGLDFKLEDTMHRDGELIWCMLSSVVGRVMLNVRAGTPECPENYEGVRFYWAPTNLEALHAKLARLGLGPSEITTRDYGQTEFFVVDADGFSHCFGVPTRKTA